MWRYLVPLGMCLVRGGCFFVGLGLIPNYVPAPLVG
jgi:hypothetical protein